MNVRSDFAAAVPLFQRAVQLDPNFAMTYASLGTSQFDLGETSLAAENTRKAYELRGRVSESEKFYIECQYYQFAIGDLEKARQVNELWAQTYPRVSVPLANLANIFSQLGQHDKALAELLQAISLDPGSGQNYAFLAFNYLNLNRLKEAEATAEETQVKKLDSPLLRTLLYQLAFVQNDAAGMAARISPKGVFSACNRRP
jgi:eukaryotic-like serine/threonine-protein kinase